VGTNQYIGEIKETKIVALSQFTETPIDDAGSKTENKLVIIIFNLKT
jgi:hypothetical protein